MQYGNVIDYIFLSKDFNKKDKNAIGKVTSYEVFDEHLKENKDASLLKSDHAQIVSEILFLLYKPKLYRPFVLNEAHQLLNLL